MKPQQINPDLDIKNEIREGPVHLPPKGIIGKR